MTLKYNNQQHKEYLHMTTRRGMDWLDVFGDDRDFWSAAYWDLFTGLWDSDGPVRKTDALKFMRAVKSAHTAGKYVEAAIRKGFLLEQGNPDDARSKLLFLSPQLRERLDAFFDAAVGDIRRTSRTFDTLGPSPEEF
jgi:hypothetical protein